MQAAAAVDTGLITNPHNLFQITNLSKQSILWYISVRNKSKQVVKNLVMLLWITHSNLLQILSNSMEI